MPRHNRPRRSGSSSGGDEPRAVGNGLGIPRSESGPDGDWLVRPVPGGRAVKTYRCPGCDQEIPPGVPHLVAWPAAEFGSAEERRHWHSSCWSKRGHRGPTRRRW